jgi:hypothetical protein
MVVNHGYKLQEIKQINISEYCGKNIIKRFMTTMKYFIQIIINMNMLYPLIK